MSDPKDIIPGIHNYCDRWCERCFFTSRCSVYEDVKDLTPEQQDVHNKAFWDNLSKNFAKAIEMINDAAASYGLDLSNVPPDEQVEIEQRRQQVRNQVEEHELCKLSLQYANMAIQWLKTKPGITETHVDLIQRVELGTVTEQHVNQQLAVIKDCVEVIEWYSHFTHVKFIRAMRGKLGEDGVEADDFQTDSNGSARIGLVAVERSLQSWLKLYELMPAREDDFLKMLALLQKIKNLAEKEFPNVMKFRHPFYELTSPGK